MAEPDEDPRERLHRAVRRARGFSLVLAYCDTPRRAAEETDALAAALPRLRGDGSVLERVEASLAGLALGERDFERRVQSLLLRLTTPAEEGARGALVFDASRATSGESARWDELFQRLNLQRNAMSAALDRPLVALLPAWMGATLAQRAPDLWSVRSHEVSFVSGERESEAPTLASTPGGVVDAAELIAQREAMVQALTSARTALAGRRWEDACAQADEALRRARARVAGPALREEPLRDLAEVLAVAAAASAGRGRDAEAMARVTEAIGHTEALVAMVGARAEWSAALADRRGLRARLHAEARRWDEARADATASVAAARDAHERAASQEAAVRWVERAVALADVEDARGDLERARLALAEAVAVLPSVGDALRAKVHRRLSQYDASLDQGPPGPAASPAPPRPVVTAARATGRTALDRLGVLCALLAAAIPMACCIFGSWGPSDDERYRAATATLRAADARHRASCGAVRTGDAGVGTLTAHVANATELTDEAERLSQTLRPCCVCRYDEVFDHQQPCEDGCAHLRRFDPVTGVTRGPTLGEFERRVCREIRRVIRDFRQRRQRCPAR